MTDKQTSEQAKPDISSAVSKKHTNRNDTNVTNHQNSPNNIFNKNKGGANFAMHADTKETMTVRTTTTDEDGDIKTFFHDSFKLHATQTKNYTTTATAGRTSLKKGKTIANATKAKKQPLNYEEREATLSLKHTEPQRHRSETASADCQSQRLRTDPNNFTSMAPPQHNS